MYIYIYNPPDYQIYAVEFCLVDRTIGTVYCDFPYIGNVTHNLRLTFLVHGGKSTSQAVVILVVIFYKWTIFHIAAGWWFGTFFIFPYIGNNQSQLTDFHIFERGSNHQPVVTMYALWVLPMNYIYCVLVKCTDESSLSKLRVSPPMS